MGRRDAHIFILHRVQHSLIHLSLKAPPTPAATRKLYSGFYSMANLLQVSRRETDAEKANTNFLEKRHPYAPVKLAYLVFVDRGCRDKQHSTEPEAGRYSGRHD